MYLQKFQVKELFNIILIVFKIEITTIYFCV